MAFKHSISCLDYKWGSFWCPSRLKPPSSQPCRTFTLVIWRRIARLLKISYGALKPFECVSQKGHMVGIFFHLQCHGNKKNGPWQSLNPVQRARWPVWLCWFQSMQLQNRLMFIYHTLDIESLVRQTGGKWKCLIMKCKCWRGPVLVKHFLKSRCLIGF